MMKYENWYFYTDMVHKNSKADTFETLKLFRRYIMFQSDKKVQIKSFIAIKKSLSP